MLVEVGWLLRKTGVSFIQLCAGSILCTHELKLKMACTKIIIIIKKKNCVCVHTCRQSSLYKSQSTWKCAHMDRCQAPHEWRKMNINERAGQRSFTVKRGNKPGGRRRKGIFPEQKSRCLRVRWMSGSRCCLEDTAAGLQTNKQKNGGELVATCCCCY